MKAELLALAAKVEALTGPCEETDEAIGRLLFPDRYVPEPGDEQFSVVYVWTYPFTGSLDAARSLVPEGWCIMQLSDIAFDGLCGCRLCDTQGPGDVLVFGTFNMELALTAAALRARAEAGE